MTSDWKDSVRSLANQAYHWCFDVAYREREHELRRLGELPRHQPGETTLLGAPLRFADAPSFLEEYRQVFVRESFRFRAHRDGVRVIDGNAGAGLALLFLKQLHPQCHALGFEADAAAFEALSWNVHSRHLSDVELLNKAVWSADGKLRLWAEGVEGTRSSKAANEPAGAMLSVPAARLRDHLGTGPVDFLKLTIEGGRTDVLIDCTDRLRRVDHVVVEYRSVPGREQGIDRILALLRAVGFRLYLRPEGFTSTPFLLRPNGAASDQSLTIFAFREEDAEARSNPSSA